MRAKPKTLAIGIWLRVVNVATSGSFSSVTQTRTFIDFEQNSSCLSARYGTERWTVRADFTVVG